MTEAKDPPQQIPIDEELLSDISAAFELEIDEHLSSANCLNLFDLIGEFANRGIDRWSDFSKDEQEQVRQWIIEELGVDVSNPPQNLLVGEQKWQFPPYLAEESQERAIVKVYKCPNRPLRAYEDYVLGIEEKGEADFRLFLGLAQPHKEN